MFFLRNSDKGGGGGFLLVRRERVLRVLLYVVFIGTGSSNHRVRST